MSTPRRQVSGRKAARLAPVVAAPARPLAEVGHAEIEACYRFAPIGMCVLDREFRFLRINERLAEINGCSVAGHLGRTLREVIPKIAPFIEPMLRRVLRTGRPITDYEVTGETAAHPGETRTWLAGWHPLRNDAGRIVGVSCMAVETTEQKRVEAQQREMLVALRESEAKFRRIAEHSPFGLGSYDAQGRVLFTNSRLLELVGWSHRELPRVEDWFAAFYPDPKYRREVEKQWGGDIVRVQRGELRQSPVREYRVVCRDGSVKTMEITFALEGEMTHAVFIDATERKRGAEALREATEFMRALLEFAPLPIYIRDAAHRFRLVNREWERLFRKKRAQVIGRAITEVLPRELANYLEQVNRRVLASKRTIATEETIDFPDGRHVYHSVKFPLRNAAGRVDAVGGISMDMTERIRAEEEILRLNEQLEARVAERTAELAAANRELREEIGERQRLQSQLIEVSEREQRRLGEGLHDMLGQHLTGLGMMAAVLERKLRKEGHAGAEAIAGFGAMLKDAVAAARDLSRGFYPVALEQGGLLLSLKDLAATTQAISGVRCRVRHRASFRFPEAAAIHLYRIAQEAVTNALKHAQPREILIELTAGRGVPLLRIGNDGRAFKDTKAPGSGLGLHIIRHRAQLIGAEVTISRGPTDGCTVVCALTGSGK